VLAQCHVGKDDQAWAFAVPNNNHGSSNNFKTGLNQLSVTERGIDFRDCLQKRDLVERLVRSNVNSSSSATTMGAARTAGPFSSSSGGGSSSGLSSELPCRRRDPWSHIPDNNSNKKVKVKLQGMARTCDAIVVGVEPEKDLAVLKMVGVSPDELPMPLDVGTSNDLQVGQSVLAIGNPFGLDYTLTTGVISATGRDVDGFGGRKIKGCVQTDAALHGFVGTFDRSQHGHFGQRRPREYWYWLCHPRRYHATGGEPNHSVRTGIGFAVPVVRRVVNQIIRYGRVVRPTLGI
jgi:hypothetical protein